MWKMIIGQSIYQLAVTFALHFGGARILGYDVENHKELQGQLDTIVFNTFVWMQIFNEFNSRRLDNGFNIFEGLLKNYWFLGINALMVAGQIMIVFIGGAALGVSRINGVQWVICIGCAIFCLPWAIVLRCIPDRKFQVFLEFVTKIFNAIWTPFAQAISFIYSPFGKAARAVWAPVKRLWSRIFSKANKGDTATESEAMKKDEEASNYGKLETRPSSPTSPQLNIPPITLTTPN
jgi:Ca2+-transporting ATPase